MISRPILVVGAKLAIGQYRLGVHGTCGLNNPWHHLRKMSSWVENPGRPPYVIPRGSAGLKTNTLSLTFLHMKHTGLRYLKTVLKTVSNIISCTEEALVSTLLFCQINLFQGHRSKSDLSFDTTIISSIAALHCGVSFHLLCNFYTFDHIVGNFWCNIC